MALLFLLGTFAFWRNTQTPGTRSGAMAAANTRSLAAPATGAHVSKAASAPLSTASVTRSGEVQLCDGRWVKTGKDGQLSESALADLSQRAFDDAAKSVTAAMLASGDPRSIAAVHYLMAGVGSSADMFIGSCEDDACRRRWAGSKAELPAHRDALAQLASGNADPIIYSWAHRLCAQLGTVEGRCQQISTEQWARLDPTNAAPWFQLADEARWRRDAAALDDAMFHVASSTHYEWGWGRLARSFEQYASHDPAEQFGTASLLGRAMVVDQFGRPWQGPNVRYCMPKATVDPNRRQTCEHVATILAERSDSGAARWVGTKLGTTLGWSQARLDAIETRRLAGDAAVDARPKYPTPSNFVDPTSCLALKAEADWTRSIARFGELGANEQAIVESGRAVEALAADQRRKESLELPPGGPAFSAEQLLEMNAPR